MRKRMRKYGGEDGNGRIRSGINQRVHLERQLYRHTQRVESWGTYHILVVRVKSQVSGGLISNKQ
jgi:hypothetical protein